MQTNKRLTVSRGGVSLLEVLAAIFVLSIGLFGVLAVIPFGAFQISKAQHAEYASNMLANAVEEVYIREMAKPAGWGATPWNDAEFVWVEPRMPVIAEQPQHIFRIDESFNPDGYWTELMRGQDDLDYTVRDHQRPELKFKEENNKPLSSGRYTWFFTFLPESGEDDADVDVLACYNRVPEDDRQVSISSDSFTRSRSGGTFTLPNANHLELLTQTKYVFVTWGPPTQVAGGVWCRIVFLDKSNPSAPRIVVTGALPNRIRDNRFMQVYIPSGVLYHKRVEGVPIK